MDFAYWKRRWDLVDKDDRKSITFYQEEIAPALGKFIIENEDNVDPVIKFLEEDTDIMQILRKFILNP